MDFEQSLAFALAYLVAAVALISFAISLCYDDMKRTIKNLFGKSLCFCGRHRWHYEGSKGKFDRTCKRCSRAQTYNYDTLFGGWQDVTDN